MSLTPAKTDKNRAKELERQKKDAPKQKPKGK